MNTKTSKLQVPISRELLQAINSAAAKELRTQCAFITKLLQEHPVVLEFLLHSHDTLSVNDVETAVPIGYAPLPKLPPPLVAPPAPPALPVGPVTLPDGTVCDDPYGLNDEPAPRS